ncbi:heterokaryon incompatibility protein-domain-containing protein [Paraphoma chrysanthemicola]|uniref:Heterokaryon incompatibility protein-domain-containing protein n=1 Tax=Paraphoma chrysanthemicola TaxID=798071 RepID=A0A8K0VSM8_9PLEO|nr:heterokaryon incompatibility protein-domain-containing protein [Paraphoma chrysanthemicola]
MQKTAYQTLNDPSRDFRLLRVLPERRNGRIQIELAIIPAVKNENNYCPPYRCLSYTWGSPDELYEIYMNGFVHGVRHNLSEFLALAKESFPLQWFWIDALCIDQSNTMERNIQVPRMGTIYCTAQEVVVWLGNDPSLWPIVRYISFERREEDGQSELEESYASFWAHPYWNRTWITQELLVANSITVLASTYSFAWHDLSRILDLSFQLTHSIMQNAEHLAKKRFADYITQRPHKTTPDAYRTHSIWEILCLREQTDCAVPHDRIYAFLALAVGGSNFEVCYEEKLEDLFWKAGEHFGAWSNPTHIDVLRSALNLSHADLSADLVSRSNVMLTLPLSYCTWRSRRPWKSFPSSCLHCGQGSFEQHCPTAVICTMQRKRNETSTGYVTHVLVQRKRSRIPTNDYFVVLLPDEHASTYGEEVGALVHRSKGRWTSTKDLEVLRQQLESEGSRSLSKNWAVRVGGEYVLHCIYTTNAR